MASVSSADHDYEANGNVHEEITSHESNSKCSALNRCLQSCTKPFLVETHPLPPNASLPRRFFDNLLCPPHSRLGAIIFVFSFAVISWATLYSITGDESLLGGNLFALTVLFFLCSCAGYVVNLIHLPPLLGMLIVGFILGNVPGIDIAKDINPSWSSSCRMIALAIILVRAGLGLDAKALRRLSFVVLRLAFCPCLTETIISGIASHLILGLPWPWAFMLGFIIAAVSPAVVVPSLLSLSDRGYGLDKGIPTLIIAAASLDDVLAITGFGVLLSISFSTGNIGWTLVKGPLEAIVGIAVGILFGAFVWYIPQKKSKHLILFRSSILCGLALLVIFGSKKIDWGGAGPLAALTMPFVAALRWRGEYPEGVKNPVQDVVAILWMLFQPLLFGLIGAEVEVSSLSGDIIGKGIGVLFIGLTFRMIVSFLAVLGTNLNFKERIFVPLAWSPKATVQAAVGAVAYDVAMDKGDQELIDLGKQVLMMAVLVILITAPLGSLLITLSGPRLLKLSPQHKTTVDVPEEKETEMSNGVEMMNKEAGDVEAQLLNKNGKE